MSQEIFNIVEGTYQTHCLYKPQRGLYERSIRISKGLFLHCDVLRLNCEIKLRQNEKFVEKSFQWECGYEHGGEYGRFRLCHDALECCVPISEMLWAVSMIRGLQACSIVAARVQEGMLPSQHNGWSDNGRDHINKDEHVLLVPV